MHNLVEHSHYTTAPQCALIQFHPHSSCNVDITFKSWYLVSVCFDEICFNQGSEDPVLFDLLPAQEGRDWMLQEVKLEACRFCD